MAAKESPTEVIKTCDGAPLPVAVLSMPDFVEVTAGTIANVSIPLANTEVSHAFPAGTRRFLVKLRGPTTATLKLSYAALASGTTYLSIPPGTYYGEDEISNPSLTVYFQTTAAGQVLECSSWA